ncbi:type II toxin-antitoxin system VapC family toxin [Candidatus Peregrinibacteria bacterium]|nr:type II toxin-antitoxin system VapC family toxin [Candidatus Peregrinibacteria bacterium]
MADLNTVYIADASVIIKWAINEAQNLEEALTLREDFLGEKVEIRVPVHCFPEVCNLLGRQYSGIAVSFFSYLVTSGIEEKHLDLELATITFRLMEKYERISFYDAFYHALAIREKGMFITADEKYFRKTKKEGSVMLLKDYGQKK